LCVEIRNFFSSFVLKCGCLKVLGNECNRRNASGRFAYFTDWGLRWGKVRRINNHRDPSSRSNFAPRRISKGNDWQSILQCSINWRITFLSGQCHLHTTRSFCMCTLSRSFQYASVNHNHKHKREKEEKDKKKEKCGKGDDEKWEKRKRD